MSKLNICIMRRIVHFEFSEDGTLIYTFECGHTSVNDFTKRFSEEERQAWVKRALQRSEKCYLCGDASGQNVASLLEEGSDT